MGRSKKNLIKNGQRKQINVFPKKTYKCPTSNKKMLNITHHRGNANKTAMNYHLTPVRKAIIKKTRQQVLARMWRRGSLCTVGGTVNWCGHCGKQCGGPSKH